MPNAQLAPLLFLAAATVGCASKPSPSAHPAARNGALASPAPASDDEKAFYTLGVQLAHTVAPFRVSSTELALIVRGLSDELGDRALVGHNDYSDRLHDLFVARTALTRKEQADQARPFLAAAAREPGAVQLPSGTILRVLRPGDGPSPRAGERVKVRLRGTLVDGTSFDDPKQAGAPSEFPLAGVMPCWIEGLTRMKVGERAKLVCPPGVGFGEHGMAPRVPPGATVVFDVELLQIVR